MAEEGGLRLEDELKRVNGIDVSMISCDEVMTLIKKCSREVNLLVGRLVGRLLVVSWLVSCWWVIGKWFL